MTPEQVKSTPAGPFCVKPHRRAPRYADQHIPPVGHGRLVRPTPPAAVTLESFVRGVAILLRDGERAFRPVARELNRLGAELDRAFRPVAREMAPVLRILNAAARK